MVLLAGASICSQKPAAVWCLETPCITDQVWGIFPPEWHLPQLVCLAFCTITKSHLAEILDAKVH